MFLCGGAHCANPKMRRIIASVIFMACLASHGQVKNEPAQHIVLPNPKLVRCVSSNCSPLWQDNPSSVDGVYPEQMDISLFNYKCPFLVIARYGKSVSFNDLQAAIEKQYGKGTIQHWTKTTPWLTWHLESEKLDIRLRTLDKRMAKAWRAEAGTKLLDYEDSGGPTKCDLP